MHQAQERAGFGLGWSLALRDTVFLQAVLPGACIILVASLSSVVQASLLRDFASGSAGFSTAILALFTCAMLIAWLIEGSCRGQLSEASWIFDVTPLRRSGLLIRGCATAILVRMYGAVLLLIVLSIIAFFGVSSLPQLVLAACLGLFLGLAGASWMKLRLPFSQPQVQRGSGLGNNWLNLLLVSVLLTTGLMHGELLGQLPEGDGAGVATAAGLSLLATVGVCWAYIRLGRVTATRDYLGQPGKVGKKSGFGT